MDSNDTVCPSIQNAFDLLGKKWTGLIIHVLSTGEKHFCDLQRAVPPLSDRMLVLRMKELEEADIVEREVLTGSPVRVIYRLTDKGRDLRPIMEAIASWAGRWNQVPAHG